MRGKGKPQQSTTKACDKRQSSNERAATQAEKSEGDELAERPKSGFVGSVAWRSVAIVSDVAVLY